MKLLCNLLAILSGVVTLGAPLAAAAASLPSDWPQEQTFAVADAGLVKITLPVETLSAARPGLEDVRLLDEAGNEVAYVTGHPVPSSKIVQAARSFQISLNAETTVMTLETGVTQPLSGVTLETPAQNFIKAVRVEGSADGRSWQSLVEGQPIFRQPYGGEHVFIALPAAASPWLRITVDDRRSAPIPFTGAQIQARARKPAPGEWSAVAITARDENPGETRLTLDLGAANLNLVALQIETTEPLLMRPVTLAVPHLAENYLGEQTLVQGTVYRVAVEGQPPAENLSVPVETQIPSRELFLTIKNGDSPPLSVSAVRVERRPVWLAFLARQPGTFHLLTGNSRCPAPNYDLGALNLDLESVVVTPVQWTALAANPNYQAPEVLPGITVAGAALDVSPWAFRKPVTIASAGAQQLELDLDVLAHAQPGLADVRVMRGGNQVPYLVQRPSITRALTPVVTTTNDSRNPKLSRWVIHLPRPGLPLTRLTCASPTPLFERSLSIYEELTDERGDQYRRAVGDVEWRQTPERQAKDLLFTLDTAVQGDTLFLETDNGDNPPVELGKFRVYYPVTRLLFKAKPDDELFLYYGNPQAAPPSYDLNLVAGQLLAADKKIASLSGEEPLKKSSWTGAQIPGQAGLLFWGILALVVVGLLVIISRLLPKPPPPGS
jgi:hypothetical protein